MTITGPDPEAAEETARQADAGEPCNASPSGPAFSLRMGNAEPPTKYSGDAVLRVYDTVMKLGLHQRDGVDVQRFWA